MAINGTTERLRTSTPSSAPAGPDADARCVADVLAGHPERFEALIHRYQHAVLAVVRAYVRDAHTAEDVTQEAFVKAYAALATLQQPGHFGPWLMQIARHHAGLARARQAQRRDRESLSGAEASVPAQPGANERLERVLASVEQLDEPYRSTVMQKYQLGLSCKEIAEREGVAVSTITSRLTRALAILRSVLTHGEGK